MVEPITISLTAAAVLTTLQPYLTTIATKAAEEIGKAVPAAVGKLWGALRNRMGAKEAARESLDDLLANPESEAFQTVFKVQLEKIMAQDAEFADKVKELTEAAGTKIDVKVRDGAAAVGDGAKAVGKGGIMIEGNVGGDVIGSGGEITQE